MTDEISEHTPVPFGRAGHKNKPICKQPDTFLLWMVKHLANGDKHLFALAAQKELDRRAPMKKEAETELSLEEQANQILRNAGCADLAGRKRKVNQWRGLPQGFKL